MFVLLNNKSEVLALYRDKSITLTLAGPPEIANKFMSAIHVALEVMEQQEPTLGAGIFVIDTNENMQNINQQVSGSNELKLFIALPSLNIKDNQQIRKEDFLDEFDAEYNTLSLGEVYCGIEQINKKATEHNCSLECVITIVIIKGLSELFGLKDEKAIEAITNTIFNKLNLDSELIKII